MLYFDHAASTPLYKEVHTLLCDSLLNDFANPASKHKLGSDLFKSIDKARKQILDLVDAKSYDLIFTSSATESNNQVIEHYKDSGAIVYYLSDHPSISAATRDDDIYVLENEDLVSKVDENVSLVVLSLINSQAGIIKDVETLCKNIKEKFPKAKVLLDAVQGFGKVKFSLKDSSLDYISIASHKLGGPRGIAGLIYKKGIEPKPLLHGGGHEKSLRSSTPATSLILAFAKACEISFSHLEANLEKVAQFNNFLRSELLKLHKNIEFPFTQQTCSPYILCLIFKGIASDILLRHLEMKQVYVSSTTACSSKIKGKNPMFVGLNIEEKYHKNILRISLCSMTTQDEVEAFLECFKAVIDEVGFLIKQ